MVDTPFPNLSKLSVLSSDLFSRDEVSSFEYGILSQKCVLGVTTLYFFFAVALVRDCLEVEVEVEGLDESELTALTDTEVERRGGGDSSAENERRKRKY